MDVYIWLLQLHNWMRRFRIIFQPAMKYIFYLSLLGLLTVIIVHYLQLQLPKIYGVDIAGNEPLIRFCPKHYAWPDRW